MCLNMRQSCPESRHGLCRPVSCDMGHKCSMSALLPQNTPRKCELWCEVRPDCPASALVCGRRACGAGGCGGSPDGARARRAGGTGASLVGCACVELGRVGTRCDLFKAREADVHLVCFNGPDDGAALPAAPPHRVSQPQAEPLAIVRMWCMHS